MAESYYVGEYDEDENVNKRENSRLSSRLNWGYKYTITIRIESQSIEEMPDYLNVKMALAESYESLGVNSRALEMLGLWPPKTLAPSNGIEVELADDGDEPLPKITMENWLEI
ncbi:hypothetical protein Glove_242g28 [Diversispora epigaea]|uniref:Uncharacterized protein n=1 Tax=Diversispora epigaea TaxID=1348612 RepID=A0A397I9Y9_9GLOM|nr:hypothetical protein Glove_242g28 [Diversispora epigaea]